MVKNVESVRARLKTVYRESVVDQLQSKLNLKNKHEVPSVDKIIINVGLGRAKDDKRLIEAATNTLRKITGQHPVTTKAKKSIAGFKLREGNAIGLKVTLRDARMYEFLDRLINVVLPRLRDFHGVSLRSFDKQGNYTIGLQEQSVFPELTYDDIALPHGLQVTIATTADSPAQAQALLEGFDMPFEKRGEQ